MVVTTDVIVGYKVPLIAKHICCYMFMNNWPWHCTIYIYIYTHIYTYTIHTYIHTYIHIYTWEHNVRLPKWMSCHKVIVVITGRTHYFHDYMYMYIYNMYIYIYIWENIRKHIHTYIRWKYTWIELCIYLSLWVWVAFQVLFQVGTSKTTQRDWLCKRSTLYSSI